MTTNAICFRCNSGVETAMHVFRDCSFAREVWHRWAIHVLHFQVNSLLLSFSSAGHVFSIKIFCSVSNVFYPVEKIKDLELAFDLISISLHL